MRHARGNQVMRQWRILQALDCRQWFSIDEIRDSLPRPRPHRRTILRDLEMLRRLFAIERRHGQQTGAHGYLFEFRLQKPLLLVGAKRKGK